MTQDNANHDAVPAARAFVGRPRTDKADLPTRDGTGNTDARLQALEELSALDQELELKYGIVGNPMIKAQERTPATLPPPNGHAPRGSGSTPVGGAGCATAGREGTDG